ncbi:MAG: hypothetical protein JWN46_3398 [Acidimicrobiales bacterium]|nr:hypothetical protein [Acidimicrobiales bacterium]
MRNWQKAAVVAVAMVLGGGVTTAWAQSSAGRDNAGPPAAAASTVGRDLGAGITESHFVPITPCRLVDTRLTPQGRVQPGPAGVRDFAVRGTGASFALQGGKSGGCGIPDAATSIEATFSAIFAQGTGYMRVFPTGGEIPTATFLNYVKAFNISNTGAVAIGSDAKELGVETFQSATYVVIDVDGYFVKPLAAVVNADGTLARGSRVTGISKRGQGAKDVEFDRDIRSCAFEAVVSDSGYGVVMGQVSTALSNDGNNRVYVVTTDSAGNSVNLPFHLEVTC